MKEKYRAQDEKEEFERKYENLQRKLKEKEEAAKSAKKGNEK